ncbi:MAG: hypothetical protein JKY30_15040 [Flavobacteriales bacterium]|nr:hypothetical protein [Flavobacteriales bacterium]
MSVQKSSIPFLRNSATAGGVIGSFAALLSASCCVLPLLLIQAGVATGLVAQLSWFASHKDQIFAVSVIALLVSMGLSLTNGNASRKLMIWWVIAIVVLAAAYFSPSYETDIKQWILEIWG